MHIAHLRQRLEPHEKRASVQLSTARIQRKLKITKVTSRREIKMAKALGKKIYRHLAQLRANARGRGIINEHVRGAPSGSFEMPTVQSL